MKKFSVVVCLFYLVLAVSAREGAANVWGSKAGSAPPNCTGVCGQCVPCKPVQVSVPPVSEPYPVRWKCECNGVYYDPPKSS
ncbi:UNVERIFIED_CONTAM: hypothetical protein Sradi_2219200 [Sesamum radiatum]|uniref:Epidermal patterning factor-like protein n=1 Tax=Sesamum radiatum TaxID=300843 RepID=A0AAW2T2A2_SESRA